MYFPLSSIVMGSRNKKEKDTHTNKQTFSQRSAHTSPNPEGSREELHLNRLL